MASRERELSQSTTDPHKKALHAEASRSWEKWAEELEKIAETAEHIDATTERIIAEIGPAKRED
jgi:thioesterase domain-containing protein